MNNRLRMRHIRCFLAVARQGSVTSAAEHLNSSQPAVSRSLSELEQLVGEKLFLRTGRGLLLSEAGARLRRHFDSAMTQVEAGIGGPGSRAEQRRIAVGMLPNVARTLARRAAAVLKQREPDIDLELHWSDVPDLITRLNSGRIDFLIGRLLGLEHMEGVSFEHLYAEPLIFVAPAGHPLADAPDAATLSDIRDELMVVPLPGTIVRRELDKFIKARGFDEFANKIETVSFEFTRSFLATERAVACIPLGAVRQELADGRLVRLGIHGEELVGSVGISFATGRKLSPQAELFAGIVRTEAKKMF
jgi:LysR family pca operon transcriptional activator